MAHDGVVGEGTLLSVSACDLYFQGHLVRQLVTEISLRCDEGRESSAIAAASS